jgi:hypothetical protein
MPNFLVRPLFDGPIDVIGDVHGEIDAVLALLHHLGYDEDGKHPDGRRLVFLGDLTDRGPNSLATVGLVQRLVEAERADCVLGNHDLNILLGHRKFENRWFYGHEFLDENRLVVPQVLADDVARERIRAFFRTLPLALEREDLRIVHACWNDEMIEIAKRADDLERLYEQSKAQIKQELLQHAELDDIDLGLWRQNHNPVKVLTSGVEKRTAEPFLAGGEMRHEERVIWWNDYRAGQFCVFGHYSIPVDKPHGNGRAFCADFGVGKRWKERRTKGFDGCFKETKLAAFRFPERVVVFDDGECRHTPV